MKGLLVFFPCPLAYHSMEYAYTNGAHAVDGPREACFWENSRYSFEEESEKDPLSCSISVPVTFLRLLFLHSTYHYLLLCVFFILFMART